VAEKSQMRVEKTHENAPKTQNNNAAAVSLWSHLALIQTKAGKTPERPENTRLNVF
jgi:hypothetical protein